MKHFKKFLQSNFKTIFYKIFSVFYGAIEGVISETNEKFSIKQTSIDKTNYKIYEVKNARLYTDTVHDVAMIIDKKIVKGPSIQLRNHFNVDPKLNIVFTKGTPKILKHLKGTVLSLLIGGGGNYNYWHWLLDIIPKLKIVENEIDNIDYFLFPNTEKKFQKETLKLLNISPQKILSSKSFRHIYADKIISTDFTYNLTNNPWRDHLKIPNWIYLYLKNKFIPHLKDTKKLPKKFYIDRGDSVSNSKNSRIILNETVVKDYLKNNDYEIISLTNLTFLDQVALFYQAKSIVGLHGAGFANLVFSNPKTKVLELKSNTAGDIIKNLAIQNDLDYFDISCEPKNINNRNQSGDIEINIDLLNKILKS